MKDLKAKLKDKDAEIEVLKEMVKSANLATKAKEIDIGRLRTRLNRIEKGAGTDSGSNYGGRSRGRDERSQSSRQSRLDHQARQPISNNFGVDGTIPERDAELEQTGAYYERLPQKAPLLTKTRQQEWEEAVELDRILEQERNAASKANLVKKHESNFNAYMDKLKDPGLKNQSSGLSGILGSSSPYFSSNSGVVSLPDLKQSKRESKFLAYLVVIILC